MLPYTLTAYKRPLQNPKLNPVLILVAALHKWCFFDLPLKQRNTGLPTFEADIQKMCHFFLAFAEIQARRPSRTAPDEGQHRPSQDGKPCVGNLKEAIAGILFRRQRSVAVDRYAECQRETLIMAK